jgi:serine/threonine protein kinase
MPEWKVPGYTELKMLGSGGFGDVALARHDASGILVAIKYLHSDLLADAEFAEMFRGEATVLASLDDPNVVRLYEYVEAPSGAAIVMELIGGVTLREILTYQGKTTAEAALVVLQGSLMGLAAAHRHGVVHRDYKPENVLVNGDGISKLTDFGIAARTGDHPVPAGTLAYAAPEQMAGAPADPASDIYAATATFYECLTGRPPFTGDTAEMLLRQHRSDPVPLDPLPEPLRPLVAAGMAKDPASRPTDATTFVTELNTSATGAYGRHWHDHGRSHLGEAALLLAALWPSGPPPTVQGTTVQRISLRRRVRLRHLSPLKAAIAASVVIAAAAASTALAATGSQRPTASGHPIAAVQQVSLQPSPARQSPNTGPGTSPLRTQTSQSGSSPSRTQTSQSGHPGKPVPAAPSNLTVTAVDPKDIELSWQVNSSDQTGFEISNGVTSTDVGADSTSYTWGGLSPGTYMCFKIVAYNSAGDSAWDPDVSPWYVCTTTPTS